MHAILICKQKKKHFVLTSSKTQPLCNRKKKENRRARKENHCVILMLASMQMTSMLCASKTHHSISTAPGREISESPLLLTHISTKLDTKKENKRCKQ